MSLLGNLIWFIFGGFILGLVYMFGGLVLCLTIVGIPFGLQIMKLGAFAMWPFGGEVVHKMEENEKTQIEEIYNNLTEENKDILNMVAKGMSIAQNQNNENHIPRID